MSWTRFVTGLTLPLGVALAVGPTTVHAQGDMDCLTNAEPDALAQRASPLDSVSFELAGATVKVCYGRPSANGRTMIGGASVPYGRLWRTGANEPTIIRTPVALTIAGVAVAPGTYSLYSIPNQDAWDVIVNRSYSQWGHERQYTEEVAAQEVGRGKVVTETLDEHVETFTILARDGHLVFEWETTRVLIPIGPTS